VPARSWQSSAVIILPPCIVKCYWLPLHWEDFKSLIKLRHLCGNSNGHAWLRVPRYPLILSTTCDGWTHRNKLLSYYWQQLKSKQQGLLAFMELDDRNQASWGYWILQLIRLPSMPIFSDAVLQFWPQSSKSGEWTLAFKVYRNSRKKKLGKTESEAWIGSVWPTMTQRKYLPASVARKLGNLKW